MTPRIVVLCGRTIHREAYRAANAQETLAGHIVLSCGVFKGDPEWGEPAKANLDELHRRKIDMADEVLLIEPGDIGESKAREIEYARKLGKPVRHFRLGVSAQGGVASARNGWASALTMEQVAGLPPAQAPASLLPEYLQAEAEITRLNWMTQVKLAHAYRAAGFVIPPKMEEECGFVVQRLLALAREHGMKWRDVAQEELKAAMVAHTAVAGNEAT